MFSCEWLWLEKTVLKIRTDCANTCKKAKYEPTDKLAMSFKV
jgi:hypothetical protein